MKFWASIAFGALAFVIAEALMRLKDSKNILEALDINSGVEFKKNILLRFFGSIGLSLVAALVVIPQLVIENEENEMLKSIDIQSISITPENTDLRVSIPFDELDVVRQFFKSSQITGANHDSGNHEFTLEITTSSKKIIYNAVIPKRNDSDVRINFHKAIGRSYIKIPKFGKFLKDARYL